MLLVAATGCGTDRAHDDGPLRAAAPGAADWAALGLPYGRLVGNWPGTYQLGYGQASVAVEVEGPTADPKEAGYDDTPDRYLVSMTAASHAGLFTFDLRDGRGEVWALDADGRWTRVGTDVVGIAIAEVGEPLAFWTERRSDGDVLVAYDGPREDITAELAVTRGTLAWGVSDGVAQVASNGATFGWDPQGDNGLVTASVPPLPPGRRDVVFARYDPSGRFAAVQYAYAHGWDVVTTDGTVIDLHPASVVPPHGRLAHLSWTADGRFLVEAGDRTALCEVPEGSCISLEGRDEGADGAFGQVVATEPQDEG